MPAPASGSDQPAMTPSTIPATSRSLDDIPGPKGVPLVGNLFDIKQSTMIQDLIALAREWGPLFRLNTPTGTRYVASGLEMVNDLCDDARFDKLVGVSQRELRKTHTSAGLFTADTTTLCGNRRTTSFCPASAPGR